MDIPQDIIDNVIAAVGYHPRVLKQCALVSSSFLLPSRKHLFSRITLRSDQSCQGIHQFLVQNPVIQSFVRSIHLIHVRAFRFQRRKRKSTSNPPGWMDGQSLLAILRLPFCCLECFSFSRCPNCFPICDCRHWKVSWDWKIFQVSSELKDALSNIIHSSTLKTLSLEGITKVPISFFQHIHITTLDLNSISPIDFCDESSLTRAASKGVAPVASHTVIDQCFWRLKLPQYEIPFTRLFSTNPRQKRANMITKSIFLPFMSRIRSLEIHICLSSISGEDDFYLLSLVIRLLPISPTSPAILEHLELNVEFPDIACDYNSFYDNLRDASLWRHVDSIATHPTESRLQRVDINIRYEYDEDMDEPDGDKVKKIVFDSLPLLRMKDMLFVEAIGEDWPG